MRHRGVTEESTGDTSTSVPTTPVTAKPLPSTPSAEPQANELVVEDVTYRIEVEECQDPAAGGFDVLGALYERSGTLVGGFSVEQVDRVDIYQRVGHWLPGRDGGPARLFEGDLFNDGGSIILVSWTDAPLIGRFIAAHGDFAMTAESPTADQFGAALARFRAELGPEVARELFPDDGTGRSPTPAEKATFTDVYTEVVGLNRWAYVIECP